MGWTVTDFIELVDEADLPEIREALHAWWEPVGDTGHACGMTVQLVDGSVWYLECLELDDETTYAAPKRVKTHQMTPKSKLYVSHLVWNVVTAKITAELDTIYCRK